MTAKEKLRQVVDELSEKDAEATLHYLDERRASSSDPLVSMLDSAPDDDEAESTEEAAGAQEAREQYQRGEFNDADEIKHELT